MPLIIFDFFAVIVPLKGAVGHSYGLAASELTERIVQMAQIGSVSVIGIATRPDN
jgi:hypothetical protein